MFLSMISALALAATAPAPKTVSSESTAGTTTNGVGAKATPKKSKSKKICREDPATTGSRLAKRICKTQEQWDDGADPAEASQKSKGAVG